MTIINLFKRVRQLVEQDDYISLKTLKPEKPEKFNWVADIFEPLNSKVDPEGKALIWIYDNQRRDYSFSALTEKSNQFLNFLRKHGIEKGDKLIAQLPLLPINWIGYLGCIKGGVVVSPTATSMKIRGMKFRFKAISPEVVIADAGSAQKIDDVESELGQAIKLKIIVGAEREGWVNVEEAFTESTEAEPADTRADDDLFYFFTSGTTGRPKVVVHTHFTYPVGHLTTASWVGLKKGDLHYNISQPGWAKFFWSSFFAPWNMGATILGYHTDRFNAKEQLQNIQDLGVTTFCAPPTALRTLIQEDFAPYKFKLRQCVAAGEPLNPEIIQVWKKGTGVTIRDGYGQTESTAMVCNLPGEKVKFGAMGKPTFMYDIIIADEDGKELGPTEEGNICVREKTGVGNGIFKTYLHDKEREGKVFKHGLYYTGDKAYSDADGYLWFVGRDDDVIKASDFRIGPFEVESVLLEHELVQEAAVVASPHKLRHNAVKAYVVLVKHATPSEALSKTLFRYAEQHLAKYKIPRIIEYVEDLPKTSSGKIRRVELREQEKINKEKAVACDREFYHDKY